MEKDLYYLMENPDSPNKELHIFKNNENKCLCKKLSFHKTSVTNDSDTVTKSEMRFLCADKGEKVCGFVYLNFMGISQRTKFSSEF